MATVDEQQICRVATVKQDAIHKKDYSNRGLRTESAIESRHATSDRRLSKLEMLHKSGTAEK
jgi:hypothetical protein